MCRGSSGSSQQGRTEAVLCSRTGGVGNPLLGRRHGRAPTPGLYQRAALACIPPPWYPPVHDFPPPMMYLVRCTPSNTCVSLLQLLSLLLSLWLPLLLCLSVAVSADMSVALPTHAVFTTCCLYITCCNRKASSQLDNVPSVSHASADVLHLPRLKVLTLTLTE